MRRSSESRRQDKTRQWQHESKRLRAERQALATSSAREASVARDADMVDNAQLGGEKPVSSIGSPVCHTFFDLIMMMRDANGVSEVKYKNLVERCVIHPEEKEMYKVLRNSGTLFLHENLWDRWSRGLSFVKGCRRDMTCVKGTVSCADNSRHCVCRDQSAPSRS